MKIILFPYSRKIFHNAAKIKHQLEEKVCVLKFCVENNCVLKFCLNKIKKKIIFIKVHLLILFLSLFKKF